MKRIAQLLFSACFVAAFRPAEAALPAFAPAADPTAAEETAALAGEIPADTAALQLSDAATVAPSAAPARPVKQRFLPTSRRIDREINKIKYAYKGEVMVGLTASYGTLSSEDSDFLVVVDNIDADGTIASVKPYIGYFYSDNHCIGARFGYTYLAATLNAAQFDLGEGNDVAFDMPYIGAKSRNYAFGLFHRTYAGLDAKGRFGLFAELELAVSSGRSEFSYESGDELRTTFSDNLKASFSFNPGAAVYIFPNVCATLSFGLGGIQYTRVTQKDPDGNKIGSRTASKMRFRLNLAAINIGMTVHLWNKHKENL